MREYVISVPVGFASTSAILRTPLGEGPFPLVVHGPGWMSTKDAGHYVRYHEEFAARGIASLIIDYRVMNDGSPAPIIDPLLMAEDLVAAAVHGASLDEIDGRRVVILGTGGVGAAAAVVAGARAPGVSAVVAVSPIATGESWLSFMRTPEQMERLLATVEEDRRSRAAGRPGATVPPLGGISIPPPERAKLNFKADIRSAMPSEVALETVERLLAFRPIDEVAAIAPRELVLIACRDDVAVRFEDAITLLDRAGDPSRLVIFEGTSSYRMHDSHWRLIADEVVELVARLDEPGSSSTKGEL
ncbi:MAG: peptidase [Rhodoglobus sp.]|nr:peptidase [Rhodoglobus sp.]